jgi:hypothetical protein
MHSGMEICVRQEVVTVSKVAIQWLILSSFYFRVPPWRQSILKEILGDFTLFLQQTDDLIT